MCIFPMSLNWIWMDMNADMNADMNESDNNDECQMEDEHNEQTLSVFVSTSAKNTKRKVCTNTNLNGKIIANIK